MEGESAHERLEKEYINYSINWCGIEIEVRHCPDWIGFEDREVVQHIEVHAKNREKLPITETGFKSHFLIGKAALDDYEYASAYVLAWLEYERKSKNW